MPATTDTPPVNKAFLTPGEVAEWLNLPESAIRNLHRLHELRGLVIARRLRFDPAAVREYIEKIKRGK
jgi:excisionase family DNA binding protein